MKKKDDISGIIYHLGIFQPRTEFPVHPHFYFGPENTTKSHHLNFPSLKTKCTCCVPGSVVIKRKPNPAPFCGCQADHFLGLTGHFH